MSVQNRFSYTMLPIIAFKINASIIVTYSMSEVHSIPTEQQSVTYKTALFCSSNHLLDNDLHQEPMLTLWFYYERIGKVASKNKSIRKNLSESSVFLTKSSKLSYIKYNFWQFIKKSVYRASFRINQGAFEITRRTLDCRTWILFMWVGAHCPQTGNVMFVNSLPPDLIVKTIDLKILKTNLHLQLICKILASF
ncbi:hypothetical protein AGLY_015645 [Aphis glycines]|uniref:Uncharacterized protein n=1 Tax=Aphis glycines TaxID=307491 RepID=A0A6G0T0S1_APHGL|nr:hypothetical protein AGLY_015645 [Aphis glycines]